MPRPRLCFGAVVMYGDAAAPDAASDLRSVCVIALKLACRWTSADNHHCWAVVAHCIVSGRHCV